MTIENIEVKVGDEVRVGMQLMTVDEITEFNTVVVIDQDGEELELTENEIDVYEKPQPKPINLVVDYDEEWNVEGYYNDDNGNDIRCRD